MGEQQISIIEMIIITHTQKKDIKIMMDQIKTRYNCHQGTLTTDGMMESYQNSLQEMLPEVVIATKASWPFGCYGYEGKHLTGRYPCSLIESIMAS